MTKSDHLSMLNLLYQWHITSRDDMLLVIYKEVLE